MWKSNSEIIEQINAIKSGPAPINRYFLQLILNKTKIFQTGINASRHFLQAFLKIFRKHIVKKIRIKTKISYNKKCFMIGGLSILIIHHVSDPKYF